MNFIAGGEYRALLAAHNKIQDVQFPVVVQEKTAKANSDAKDAGENKTISLADVGEFVDYFIAAGKKGVAINRYKGLGEMNPHTLWTTTMDPEHRTLLQVRAEDDVVASETFSILMGDDVAPRRAFIEKNALDVKNLDI